jgi:hypothetical protein
VIATMHYSPSCSNATYASSDDGHYCVEYIEVAEYALAAEEELPQARDWPPPIESGRPATHPNPVAEPRCRDPPARRGGGP